MSNPARAALSLGLRVSGRARGAHPIQRAGDAGDTLADLIGGDARERQPQAGAAALQHEVRAGNEGDLLLERSRVELCGVDVTLEGEPEEIAAARLDEVGLGNLLAKRGDQGV